MKELKFPSMTPASLYIWKNKDKYVADLKINDYILNETSDEFKIALEEFENKTIPVYIDGKNIVDKGKNLVKTYKNIFDKDKIVDWKNGKITCEGIVIGQCEGGKRSSYKVNVQNDAEYTVVRYANLHQHTEYSLLDGIVRIPDLVKKTEYACAVTDHGNMNGWRDLLLESRKANKLGMIGIEVYMADMDKQRAEVENAAKFSGALNNEEMSVEELMFDNSRTLNPEGLNGSHLILIAKNDEGVKNLWKLATKANERENFHRKPHVTWENLEKYHSGIICTTACIASQLGQSIKKYLRAAQDNEVKEWIDRAGDFFYKSTEYQYTEPSGNVALYAYYHNNSRRFIDTLYGWFGEDFYLEVQDHHFKEESVVMDEIKKIQREEYPYIKIVATCDAHYLNKEDAYSHELWLCSQTQTDINDPKHMRFSGDGYWVHTSQEMLELFPEEYLDNTLEVADKVHYELKNTGYHLPHFPVPKGKTEKQYFREMCRKGFRERFEGTPKFKDKTYLDRMVYEIEVIENMGWPSYFLMTQDFIKWCEDDHVADHPEVYFPNKKLEEIPAEMLKDYRIYCGPGRGSGAGSLVNYCLGITKVDPIKYNLLFSRFLNPDRVSMPE